MPRKTGGGRTTRKSPSKGVKSVRPARFKERKSTTSRKKTSKR